MAFSPIPSAETSTPGELWNAFHHWEVNASLDESITRMEDFICTSTSYSNGDSEVERLTSSMWTVGTRTLAVLNEHRRRITTTRSRMEMLSLEGWEGRSRAQWEVGRLLISGLESRRQRIEMNFGSWCTNWIPKLLSAISTPSVAMLTGDLPRYLPSMSTMDELSLFREMLTVEIDGYRNLVSDWANHS